MEVDNQVRLEKGTGLCLKKLESCENNQAKITANTRGVLRGDIANMPFSLSISLGMKT